MTNTKAIIQSTKTSNSRIRQRSTFWNVDNSTTMPIFHIIVKAGSIQLELALAGYSKKDIKLN